MKNFWIDALERAIKTAVQVALTFFTTAMFITDIPWIHVLSAAALGFVYSMLTSIASMNIGDKTTASVLPPAIKPEDTTTNK